ncbi:MAG: PDZ domain-containing protein [Verrucomicrobiota bacterium JB023]|nr:PDZ domain-containing protein [Verrucomicrobiota bacterium JB023]
MIGLRYLLLLSCFSLLARAQEAEMAQTEAIGEQELGNDDFAVRQDGFEALKAWSQTGEREQRRDELLDRYFASDDPEERFRIREVLFEITLGEFEQSGPGFLGIQMDRPQVFFQPRNNNNGPLQNAGVGIASVIPETPADEAGLKAGDTILRVDKLDVRRFDGMDILQVYLKDLRPGTEIEIEVLREDETLVKKARLMNRLAIEGAEEPIPTGPSRVDSEKREQLLRADFGRWLLKQQGEVLEESEPEPQGPAPEENR